MKIFWTWIISKGSSTLTVVGYDRRDGPYSRGGGGGYGNHARDNYGACAESHRNVRVYQYSNADNYGGGGGGGYDRRDNYGGGGGGYGRDNYGEDVRCSHVKEKSLLMSRHLV